MDHHVSVSTKAAAAADFRDVTTWIFDLDNTLYPAGSTIFAQIDDCMTDYIASHLHMSWDEARALQHKYYTEYGTSLTGLVRNHHIDPEDYLQSVHKIDLSALEPDPALREGLERLPGRRIVFTNGSSEHAERVLQKRGLDGTIDAIWDIRCSNFVPKPEAESYTRMIGGLDINPVSSAFFEDMAINLIPAAMLGMTTVCIAAESAVFSPDERRHIAYRTSNLAKFLHVIEV